MGFVSIWDDACGRPGRSEVGEHFGRECVVWVGRMAKVTYSFRTSPRDLNQTLFSRVHF